MKSAADKYIESKNKNKMQQGGEMQAPPMQPQQQQQPVEEEGYEVTLRDDTGLVKYKFSTTKTIQ